MAQEAEVLLDRDQFNCSICLYTLRNPVTIPCGHNYCSDCIQNYWDHDDFLGAFVCPQCRQTFNPRPPLARNTVLADVLERFRRTGLREAEASATAGPVAAQAGDVECDVCSGTKSKAVRSCLVCLASYCELHVKPHFESPAFKKHKLVAASGRLQDTLCPRHGKLLEVYCRSDRRCICPLCLTDEHRGHDTVLVEEESQQLQRKLSDMKQRSQLWIQQREKDAQELRQAIFSLVRSSRSAAEESDAVFTELIRSLELKRFEVREMISAQEKAAQDEVQRLLETVQKEIDQMKKTEAELDELSRAEDSVLFVQNFQALLDAPGPPCTSTVDVCQKLTFGPVVAAMADFKALLQEVCHGGFVTIYERVKDVATVDPRSPAGQCDMMLCSSSQEAGPEATASHPVGLDQNPVNPHNPFLGAAAEASPTFSFSTAPLGFRMSTVSRQNHQQRRAYPRRKR